MKIPMWHRYSVELYPHYSGKLAGWDKFGNELEFPSFFRQLKDQPDTDDPPIQKGIVKILKPGNHPRIKKGSPK